MNAEAVSQLVQVTTILESGNSEQLPNICHHVGAGEDDLWGPE